MTRDLCIMACVFCRDPVFQTWVKLQEHARKLPAVPSYRTDEDLAKAFILYSCGVASRNDLDRNPAAAQHFHDRIRKPFLAWKDEE